mgnify:CR=1 FL=1
MCDYNITMPKRKVSETKTEQPIAFLCALHGNLDHDTDNYFPNVLEHVTKLNTETGELDRTDTIFTVPLIDVPEIAEAIDDRILFTHHNYRDDDVNSGVSVNCPNDYFVQLPNNITVVDFAIPDESILVNWEVEHFLLELLEGQPDTIKEYIEQKTNIPNKIRGHGIDVGSKVQLLLNNAAIYQPNDMCPNVSLSVDDNEKGMYNARIIDGDITVSPEGHNGGKYTGINYNDHLFSGTKMVEYNGKTDTLFDDMKTERDKIKGLSNKILLGNYFMHLKNVYGNREIIIYLLNCKPLTNLTSQENFFKEEWAIYLKNYSEMGLIPSSNSLGKWASKEILQYKYLIDSENICNNSITILELMNKLYDERTHNIINARRARRKLDETDEISVYLTIESKNRGDSIVFFKTMLVEINKAMGVLTGKEGNKNIKNEARLVSTRCNYYTYFSRFLRTINRTGGKHKTKRRKQKNSKRQRKTKKNKTKNRIKL